MRRKRRERSPDLVGLTASDDSDIDMLKGVIMRLRNLPGRPRVIVGDCSSNIQNIDAYALMSRDDMALVAGNRLLW